MGRESCRKRVRGGGTKREPAKRVVCAWLRWSLFQHGRSLLGPPLFHQRNLPQEEKKRRGKEEEKKKKKRKKTTQQRQTQQRQSNNNDRPVCLSFSLSLTLSLSLSLCVC